MDRESFNHLHWNSGVRTPQERLEDYVVQHDSSDLEGSEPNTRNIKGRDSFTETSFFQFEIMFRSPGRSLHNRLKILYIYIWFNFYPLVVTNRPCNIYFNSQLKKNMLTEVVIIC